MTATLPLYLAPIVIETGVNDVIRSTHSIDGTDDCTIAAGTYYLSGDDSATCILKAIETALKAAQPNSGPQWTITSDKVTATDQEGNWSILWGHANTTFDETVLGIIAGTTWSEIQDEIETADYQSAYRWIGTRSVVSDTADIYEAEAAQSRALSGDVYTVSLGGPYAVRLISHAHEPSHKARTNTTGYENQSWAESFWPIARTGVTIRYYADSTVASWSDYVLYQDSAKEAKPTQQYSGLDFFAWQVTLASA